jgi:hypothetical protein
MSDSRKTIVVLKEGLKAERYTEVIVTSLEGKALCVAYDNSEGGIVLLIDNNMHCKTRNHQFQPDEAIMRIKYPFSSGEKTIEVFGKREFWKTRYQLCIDGNFFAGNNFPRKRKPVELTVGDKITTWFMELPVKMEVHQGERQLKKLEKKLNELEKKQEEQERNGT